MSVCSNFDFCFCAAPTNQHLKCIILNLYGSDSAEKHCCKQTIGGCCHVVLSFNVWTTNILSETSFKSRSTALNSVRVGARLPAKCRSKERNEFGTVLYIEMKTINETMLTAGLSASTSFRLLQMNFSCSHDSICETDTHNWWMMMCCLFCELERRNEKYTNHISKTLCFTQRVSVHFGFRETKRNINAGHWPMRLCDSLEKVLNVFWVVTIQTQLLNYYRLSLREALWPKQITCDLQYTFFFWGDKIRVDEKEEEDDDEQDIDRLKKHVIDSAFVLNHSFQAAMDIDIGQITHPHRSFTIPTILRL